MKLTFLVLALAMVCALSSPQQAKADTDAAPLPAVGHAHVFGGPEVPFPLSAQVDFPWATIEGVWQAKGKNFNTEFSFRIQSDGTNGRILGVTQINPDNQTVVAKGTGFSNDDARTVRAVMVGAQSGQSYWLIIRAFKNDKSGKIETVLTVRSFDGSDGTNEAEMHIVVRKLKSSPMENVAIIPDCAF